MKRCFGWLKKFFIQWNKKSWQEKVAQIIGVVFSIISFIFIFSIIDTKPATPKDYSVLEELAIRVQETPETLIETNCKVQIYDEIVVITFESDECRLYAKYTKDGLNMISYSREDRANSWLYAVSVALIIALGVYAIIFLIVIIILWLIYFFVKLIFKKVKHQVKRHR